MSVTQEQVLDALRTVQDPDLHKDIVTLGFVKEVQICGGEVGFTIVSAEDEERYEFTFPLGEIRAELRKRMTN